MAYPVLKITIAFHQPKVGLNFRSALVFSVVKLEIHRWQRTVFQGIIKNQKLSLQSQSKKWGTSFSGTYNFDSKFTSQISSKITTLPLKIYKSGVNCCNLG